VAGATGRAQCVAAGRCQPVLQHRYRGVPSVLVDLTARRPHLLFVPLARALPLIRDGRAKVLAVANGTRLTAVPEIFTGLEAGYTSLFQERLVGLFGWCGMASARAEMLASEAQSTMAALSDHLPVRGQSPSPRRLQALNALLRSERAPLAGFVRDFSPTPTWPRQSRRVLPGDFAARGDFAPQSHP
jgi:tripartite-type tricarboxylate transporter receptor subunit TctC